MATVAWVFARGGSQGLPRKNLATVAGISLLERAIATARDSGVVDEVYVSTDDEEIAVAGRTAGAVVPFLRPPELATATVSEIEAWRHAIDWLRRDGTAIDVIVSVPAIAPLRRPEDVAATVSRRAETDADLAVTVTAFEPNPRFTAVEVDRTGGVSFAFGRRYVRRQDAPPLYRIVPLCYAARAPYVLAATDLFEGRVTGVEVPGERAVDIDTPADLEYAEFLLQRT